MILHADFGASICGTSSFLDSLPLNFCSTSLKRCLLIHKASKAQVFWHPEQFSDVLSHGKIGVWIRQKSFKFTNIARILSFLSLKGRFPSSFYLPSYSWVLLVLHTVGCCWCCWCFIQLGDVICLTSILYLVSLSAVSARGLVSAFHIAVTGICKPPLPFFVDITCYNSEGQGSCHSCHGPASYFMLSLVNKKYNPIPLFKIVV